MENILLPVTSSDQCGGFLFLDGPVEFLAEPHSACCLLLLLHPVSLLVCVCVCVNTQEPGTGAVGSTLLVGLGFLLETLQLQDHLKLILISFICS